MKNIRLPVKMIFLVLLYISENAMAPYLYSKGLCESILMDWLAYSGR